MQAFKSTEALQLHAKPFTVRYTQDSNQVFRFALLTFAEYGLPTVGCPSTVTLTRCSPTTRGTNSALNTPSAVCRTCAGTEWPDGPVFCVTVLTGVLGEFARVLGFFLVWFGVERGRQKDSVL